MTGYINMINLIDTTNLTISFGYTSTFISTFLMFMGALITMLPIAKYLVWVKDVRDWRLLSTITEMGLEEQDLRNQMAEDFVYSCEQLAEMDEAHMTATDVVSKLRQDLELMQDLLEEKQAMVHALQTQVAQLSRKAKAKRPSNIMPMLTKNVERQGQGYNLFYGNPLPMESVLES